MIVRRVLYYSSFLTQNSNLQISIQNYKRIINMQKQQEFEEVDVTQQEYREAHNLNKNGRPKQEVVFFQLTPQIKQQAHQLILKDINYMAEQEYKKIIQNAGRTWDKFYKNHKCNFFKDRKYLEKQIPELTLFRERYQNTKQMSIFVQLGCGVGNTFFPIHNQFENFRLYGCDFAASAIKLINKEIEDNKPKYDRIRVEQCDLVHQQIPKYFQKGDLVTLIFVLSAIAPEQHFNVIQKIYDWMKPDSYFYFRDYGRYDFGQLNMTRKGNRKLKDNFYAKHDGVCVYYFTEEQIIQMCEKVGFQKIQMVSHCKLLQNRKTGLKMYRIWLQGRFYKPKTQLPLHLNEVKNIESEMKQKSQQTIKQFKQ